MSCVEQGDKARSGVVTNVVKNYCFLMIVSQIFSRPHVTVQLERSAAVLSAWRIATICAKWVEV